jgi:hypothetical protein
MAHWTPLESSWAKFHRAEAHRVSLKGELDRVMDDEEGALHVKTEIKGLEACQRVTRLPDFREAGLIFGDAVANYRAALDHLAWDLVQLGSDPRPKRPNQVQFPFAALARKFRTAEHRQRRAPGISDTQWRLMGRYQPYTHGKRGRAMRSLRDISDSEKHRRVIPTISSASAFRGTIAATRCRVGPPRFFPLHRALYVGAKVVSMDVTPEGLEWDVQIEGSALLRPSLGRAVVARHQVVRWFTVCRIARHGPEWSDMLMGQRSRGWGGGEGGEGVRHAAGVGPHRVLDTTHRLLELLGVASCLEGDPKGSQPSVRGGGRGHVRPVLARFTPRRFD